MNKNDLIRTIVMTLIGGGIGLVLSLVITFIKNRNK